MRKSTHITLQEVKAMLAQRGMRMRRTSDGEFRVYHCVRLGQATSEDTAYYTSDLKDALDTGLKMADERDAPKNPGPVAPSLTNANIAKAVMKKVPELTELKIYRSPAGYFYAEGKAGTEYLTIESVYTFALKQRTFDEWVDLWASHVRYALPSFIKA